MKRLEEDRTKPKSRSGLIFFIILIALALTNPSEEEYSNWVMGKPEGSFEAAGAELLGKPLIKGMTTRSNLFFFSIFTTGAFGVETKVVGFARIVFFKFRG